MVGRREWYSQWISTTWQRGMQCPRFFFKQDAVICSSVVSRAIPREFCHFWDRMQSANIGYWEAKRVFCFSFVFITCLEPSQKTMWRFKFFLSVDLPPRTFPESHVVFRFFLWVHLRNNNLPRKPCEVSSSFVPTPPQKACWRFKVFFCTSRNKILPSKPCGVSILFLCQPAHPDPSQRKMSLFKLFFVDLRTINSPK